MSQIYKAVTASSLPPSVPTSFTTQNGTAVPAANILIINGFDSIENNDNGIISKGGVVGTGTSNEVDIVLTNRLQGTGNTTGVGVTTVDLITFSLLLIPATFVIDANICAFNASTPAGAGYSIFGTARTTGGAASLVGTPDKINNEDAVMTGAAVDYVVSGNNLIIRGTGVNGLSINWSAVATYVMVS